jgi:dolichyl-phosphate beta-glucosyltransferase
MHNAAKVCVVIPCYNEQGRFKASEFINYYQHGNLYFLFVNDGSTDLTLEILKKIRKGREDKFLILNIKKNRGKAEAVRRGVLYASSLKKFTIIGFLDADLSTPLTEISNLVSHFEKDIMFIFGSRVQRIGVTIKRNAYRHYFGRIFATIASNMLRIPVYDTQCGAKFFRNDVVELLFTDEFKSNWTFDLEIFYRYLIKYNNSDININVKEIPLENWEDIKGSKIKIIHLIKLPFDLIKIYYHYNFRIINENNL